MIEPKNAEGVKLFAPRLSTRWNRLIDRLGAKVKGLREFLSALPQLLQPSSVPGGALPMDSEGGGQPAALEPWPLGPQAWWGGGGRQERWEISSVTL